MPDDLVIRDDPRRDRGGGPGRLPARRLPAHDARPRRSPRPSRSLGRRLTAVLLIEARRRRRRSRRPAARSGRGRPRAASGRPRACRRRAGRGASRRRRRRPRASAGRTRRGRRGRLRHTRRPERRRTTSSSGTSISSTAVSRRPSSLERLVERVGLARVRGKPSSRKPSRASRRRCARGSSPMMSSSGTSSPASMYSFAFAPSSVLLLDARRAACRPSRCRAGRSPPAGARPACPCRRPEGRGG